MQPIADKIVREFNKFHFQKYFYYWQTTLDANETDSQANLSGKRSEPQASCSPSGPQIPKVSFTPNEVELSTTLKNDLGVLQTKSTNETKWDQNILPDHKILLRKAESRVSKIIGDDKKTYGEEKKDMRNGGQVQNLKKDFTMNRLLQGFQNVFIKAIKNYHI